MRFKGKAEPVFAWIALLANTTDYADLSGDYWNTYWHVVFVCQCGRN